MWNVPQLFHYSLDHLKQWFETKIYLLVMLTVAQVNGIPCLVKLVVRALAGADIPLCSWCSDLEILCYAQVEGVGLITRMKEQLYYARLAFLAVPLVTHGGDCTDTSSCRVVWEFYWSVNVGRRIRVLDDATVSHELWFIRSEILKAQIPGMTESYCTMTVNGVAANSCWFSEDSILAGAIEHLMVAERVPDWQGVNGSGDS